LDNSTEEGITFNISADGSSGSADSVSGQVTISMTAQSSEDDPQNILTETVSFTLREEKEQVESYDNMIEIANAFEIQWKDVSKYSDVKRKAFTSVEKQKQNQILRQMCNDLMRMIGQNKVDASRRIYSFLSQAEDLVDITPKVKDKLEDLNEMQKSTYLAAFQSGQNLTIKDARKGTTQFTLKPVFRSNEIEFRLE
jgi:hypothetical protein